jgi:hypothetical protein
LKPLEVTLHRATLCQQYQPQPLTPRQSLRRLSILHLPVRSLSLLTVPAVVQPATPARAILLVNAAQIMATVVSPQSTATPNLSLPSAYLSMLILGLHILLLSESRPTDYVVRRTGKHSTPFHGVDDDVLTSSKPHVRGLEFRRVLLAVGILR